ncbi:hypothetical protein CDD81_133 [Ophiocordyceps australis]|uniref:Peptidase S8/S53 domain-containing protein n=1 Tax=Ophiocordyceps australis TaxID=1399860 RepID=A0A2C5YCX2_9HYPO|nr:hypothetical protein CDD81_133 [Ophiocordyceps australis]
MVNFKNIALAATTLLTQATASPMIQAGNDMSSLAGAESGSVIPGKYIVTLKPGLETRDLDNHLSWVDGVHKRGMSAMQYKGIETKFTGKTKFQAYTGHFDKSTVDEIRNNPDVEQVEEDKVWNLAFITEKRDSAVTTQSNSTYGLAAISHRKKGATNYIYSPESGAGTYAYIIDSGIRASHNDFEGRAKAVYSAFDDEKVDTIGHGTHVAGTIGGKRYGVAKKTQLLSVKVFKGAASSTSVILQGYNWAANDIMDKDREDVSVINMSLGGLFSFSFNAAVRAASDAGILSVVAAGNEAQNCRTVSPASAPSAITVGAMDENWGIAYYSNFGNCVDIFGPGSNITSTWYTGDNAVNTISGTSMATPHIVGLALNAISVHGVNGVEDVTNNLKSTATKNQIKGNLRGSPNALGNNDNKQQN